MSKINPSPIQRKAAKAVLENLAKDHPAKLGVILSNVGYGKGLSQQPNRVIQSLGFKLALKELGLTEELVTTALVSDIKAKPANRIQELKLGAELLGMVKRDEPDQPKTNNTYNFIFNEQTQAEVRKINEVIKEQLIKPNAPENQTPV